MLRDKERERYQVGERERERKKDRHSNMGRKKKLTGEMLSE